MSEENEFSGFSIAKLAPPPPILTISTPTGKPLLAILPDGTVEADNLNYANEAGKVFVEYVSGFLKSSHTEKDAEIARLREALEPFARYVDKQTCTITLLWEDGDYQSTYRGTLKPEDFFKARAALGKDKT